MLKHGPLDLHLNAKGELDAQRAADIFSKHPIDLIITSPLHRCIETAKFIQKYHIHSPLIVAYDLEERRYGDWSIHADKIQQIIDISGDGPKFFGKIKQLIEDLLPADAENHQMFESRIYCAISKYLTAFKEDINILFVGHGCVRKAIESGFDLQPQERVNYAEPLEYLVDSVTGNWDIREF